ncbi:WYL domain-containing protein [Thiolapillus sp.]|uniref:WYL domain-containing protein n=1 Tax=Thiolapillus sp. TaxID=2017437 RepID=UPI003AF4B3E0
MSGDGPSEKMRWSIERRLEFIEFRLFWEGRVNRSDLVDFFGISVPQASADLGRYQEVAKQNLVYDKRAKSYLVTREFKPVLLELDAQRYLAQLRLIANGILPKEESWLGWVPPYATVPSIARSVDPVKLRKVLDVIRTGSAIHVEYQSLSRPDPLWRWLTPHALAFDGFRWHVRAWCHTRNRFQDFVFARMLSLDETRPDQINAEYDVEWQRFLTFRIGPHPDLGKAARKAIELDYGMQQGEISVETRISLSFYLERRLGLDFKPEEVRPERQQIILLNRKEVDEAQKRARSETAALASKYVERSEEN